MSEKSKPPKVYLGSVEQLFENNRLWAQKRVSRDPDFFRNLSKQQSPQIVWIGCADSRVPSNQIIKLRPGEVFTHRNIANVVTHTDLNVLSVLSYAVGVLKVKHVVVCGHYGCGGVIAAEGTDQLGLIDNWLMNIKDVYRDNRNLLEVLPPGKERTDLLVELNVARSVDNICHTSIVQNAWKSGQQLTVHGWCYSIADGLLRDLELDTSSGEQADFNFAMSTIRKKFRTSHINKIGMQFRNSQEDFEVLQNQSEKHRLSEIQVTPQTKIALPETPNQGRERDTERDQKKNQTEEENPQFGLIATGLFLFSFGLLATKVYLHHQQLAHT